jgi:signal transduction histidine kinase
LIPTLIMLGMVSSLAISALILRKLDAINQVAEEIRGGNIHQRIPTTGTGDEFDRLAGHLNGMLDSIEDLTEGLRQVSNEIAHQMRTPLSRIRGKLEATRRDQLSQAHLNAVIDAISIELDSLLGAFSAMLRIAQLDAGASRQAFRNFDLSELLVGVVQDFGPIAEDVNIAMRPRIAPDLRFFGDRRLITQMVVNLIENHRNPVPAKSPLDRTDGSECYDQCGQWHQNTGGEYDHAALPTGRGPAVRLRTGPRLVASIAKMHGIGVSLNDNRPGLRVDLEFPMPASAPRAEAVGAIGRAPTPAGTTPGRAE